MIIILGKTCSGKNTVVDRLVEKYGYKCVVTYTTRPMRKGEIQDETYHFISEEEFLEKIDSEFFMEYKEYNTVHGKWYYGSAKDDYDDSSNKVIILTPSGFEDVLYQLRREKNITYNEIISIYLYANNKTILKRLKHRGDNKEEANRRIETDNTDFKGVVDIADKIVYNNEEDIVEDVVDKIHKYIQSIVE